MSPQRLRRRMTLEAVLAGCFLALALTTTVFLEWFEALTGLEPDGGSGALEWGLTAAFGLASVTAAVLARRDLTRVRASTA